ncbi:MAG: hydrolase 2, exosortase A system-associated [Pseudomonadota bacterium]
MMRDLAMGATPVFLDTSRGQRFCLFHAPDPGRARGAIVYVPPFAEELNKCRRMAALQARRFAQAGYAVLQIDLYGCGDSSGDFGDARWEIWLQDLVHACRWLRQRGHGQVSLWGVRLGALLAIDFACSAGITPQALVLWQPVVSGRTHLHQFLRVGRAARMLATEGGPETHAVAGQGAAVETAPVEVAGYTLAPALVDAIGQRDAAFVTPPCPVYWLEVPIGSTPAHDVTPSSARHITHWRAMGVPVQVQSVPGPAFWASTETVLCPALLDATSALELP